MKMEFNTSVVFLHSGLFLAEIHLCDVEVLVLTSEIATSHAAIYRGDEIWRTPIDSESDVLGVIEALQWILEQIQLDDPYVRAFAEHILQHVRELVENDEAISIPLKISMTVDEMQRRFSEDRAHFQKTLRDHLEPPTSAP